MFNTPLHAACVNGDEHIVKLLLSHDANINARNAEQQTPMHNAAANNHSHVRISQ